MLLEEGGDNCMQRRELYFVLRLVLLMILFHQAILAQVDRAGRSLTKTSLLVQASDKKGTHLKGLTSEMLRLFEGTSEQKILSVVEEPPQHISLVLVINLGIDPYCGFTNLGQFLGWLNTSLNATLTNADEVAAIVTYDKGIWAFQFSDSPSKREEMLGNERNLKGEIAKWNGRWGEPEVIDIGKLFVTPEGPDQVNFESVNIVVQRHNYLGAATQQGIQYLINARKKGNRPVILFCNSLHNVVDQDIFLQEMKGLTSRKEVLVGWVGASSPADFEEFVRGVPWDKIKTGSLAAFSLILTRLGGEVIDCGMFSPIWNKKKQYREFRRETERLLNNLRTRYKITYESDNPDLTKPRNIKLEMSPKWKGGKVTLHYPQVIYPQADK